MRTTQADSPGKAATATAKSDMLPSLQAGRALAALLVLVYHSGITLRDQGYRDFSIAGAAGVDIFFVISGFVIYLVSRRDSAGRFMLKRVIRVGPPYWFYTSLTCAILLIMPSLYSTLRFDPTHALLSYFFIMSDNGFGGIGTVLGVGWTLVYEMYFYVLAALALLISRRFALLIVGVAIIGGASLSFLVVPPHAAIPPISALPLEFLAGAVLAKLFLDGVRLPVWTACLAIVLGLAVIGVTGYLELVPRWPYEPERVLWFGVPSLFIVWGLVSLDRVFVFPRWSLWIGAISYSLYLSHPFVLKLASKLLVRAEVPGILQVPVYIALALAAAHLSYRLIEKPSLNWLTRRLGVRAGPGGVEGSIAAPIGKVP